MSKNLRVHWGKSDYLKEKQIHILVKVDIFGVSVTDILRRTKSVRVLIREAIVLNGLISTKK